MNQEPYVKQYRKARILQNMAWYGMIFSGTLSCLFALQFNIWTLGLIISMPSSFFFVKMLHDFKCMEKEAWTKMPDDSMAVDCLKGGE